MDTFQWISSLLLGATAVYYAKKRGKNPYLWFMLGFFFGLTGLLFLLFFPRLKNSFRKKKPTPPMQAQTSPSLFLSPYPLNTIWYYLDGEMKQQGPVSLKKLEEMKRGGLVHPKTYIWNDSLPQWKKWDEVFPSLDGI
jgi:hypothetical protein